MFLRKSLGFSIHNVYFQVSVKIAVSYEPGCIDNVPEYFILESLYDVYRRVDMGFYEYKANNSTKSLVQPYVKVINLFVCYDSPMSIVP